MLETHRDPDEAWRADRPLPIVKGPLLFDFSWLPKPDFSACVTPVTAEGGAGTAPMEVEDHAPAGGPAPNGGPAVAQPEPEKRDASPASGRKRKLGDTPMKPGSPSVPPNGAGA